MNYSSEPIKHNIMDYRKDKFFSPIRDKLDYILLIVNAVEDILFRNVKKETSEESLGEIIISKGRKSRRIYFLSENKIFSVFFPFDFLKDGEIEFRYTSKQKKTYKIEIADLSYIRSVIYSLKNIENKKDDEKSKSSTKNNQYEGLGCCFSSIFDYLFSSEIDPELTPKIGELLYGLFSCEEGYIRYDYDRENEKDNHPCHHLDICYDDKNTYKIGLRKRYSYEELNELLDNSFKRKYLY